MQIKPCLQFYFLSHIVDFEGFCSIRKFKSFTFIANIVFCYISRPTKYKNQKSHGEVCENGTE